MSDILSRMPVVFEDENGNILPHRDNASNSYFNSANTGLNSDNVQDAIKEVNNKIGNASSNTTCNVIKLQDCVGYESRFALNDFPTYNYKNGNNESYDATTFYIDSHNKSILDLADATTIFIQNVINNLKESDILIFPENKIFLISYSKVGYQYGLEDLAYTIEEYQNLDWNTQHSTQFYGLTIRTPVHINLNNSTLKAIPSFFHIYTLIDIKPRLWGYSDSTDSDNPSGTSIVNGILFGFKKEGDNFDTNVYDVENSMGIHATVKVLLENLEVHSFYGDCLCVSSKDDYSNNPRITFSQNSYLNPTTGKLATTNSRNLWTSGFYNINAFKYHYYKYKLIFRPVFDDENIRSYVDMSNAFVNEKCIVSYYADNNENAFVSTQIIHFGDMLDVPSTASHVRFCIDVDSSLYKSSGNLDIKLLCVTIAPDYGTIIRGCTMYDCTRDGITSSSVYNGLIQNCRIYGCEQADIDIESLAYADKALTIDGLIAGSISSTTPYNIVIKNSTIDYFKTDCPNYIFDNCDIGQVVIDGPSYDYGFNISLPRRIFKNSIIRNDLNAVDTIFDNCIISGRMDRTAYTNLHSGGHLNKFTNCIFKTKSILPGIYNSCKFMPRFVIYDTNQQAYVISRELELQVFGTVTEYTPMEDNEYRFINCEFDVDCIYSSDSQFGAAQRVGALLYVDKCIFSITKGKQNSGESDPNMDARCSNFAHCYISNFTNSKVFVNTNVPRYNNGGMATSFILSFNLYNNTKINNNIFIASEQGTYCNFIRIALNNIISNDSYFVSIKNNIVKYYCTDHTQSKQPTFVFVQPKSSNDNILIELENNSFKVLGEFTDVSELPSAGDANVIYHNTTDNKYYKWIAQSMWGTSGSGYANVIYYNTQNQQFYTWEGSNFVQAVNENGYREVGKISDITFDYNAESGYVDHVSVEAPAVSATIKNSRAIDGSVNEVSDSRINRL